MNPRTTVFLLLVVAVLAVLVWKQTEREDPEAMTVQVPLLEGYDSSRVTRIRLDHLERSTHLALERDAAGRWFLTDPMAYPARREMLRQILQVLGNAATKVSAGELEFSDPGLDPPRAVLEVTESLPSGEKLVREIEVGAVDIDGMRVYARVDGQVLRTMRNLETPLQQHPFDWRSRSVFELEDTSVVEFLREGFWYEGEVQTALGAQGQRRGSTWWFERPARFHADPIALLGWTRAMATLTVSRFRSDLDEPDLARLGLENPWFSLTLVDRGGRSQTLEVSGQTGAVLAKRTDLPYVWELDEREAQRLREDARIFYDRNLARVFRAEVDKLLLRGDAANLRLAHDRAADTWTVESQDPSGEWTVPVPANGEVVDRLLGAFEQTDIVDYLWDEPVETYFPDDLPIRGLWLESDGIRYGGRFGLVRTSVDGVETQTFLREGEDVISLLPPEVSDLLALTALEARTPLLLELREGEITQIGIGLEGRTEREFRREVQGTWVHASTPELQAKELLPALDHLVYLLADEHLARDRNEELLDVVRVRIAAARQLHQVEIGRTAAGEVRAAIGGRQSILRAPELHGILLEIARKAQ